MTWHASSVRVQVWLQLRVAPLNAAEVKAALPGAKAKCVETALYLMKAEGYAEQREDGRYHLTAERPPLPAEADLPHADETAAVDLVQDCPGGIDEWLLSFELKVSPRRVQALLARPIAQRLVQRQDLPGGIVRYLPTGAAA